MLCPRLLLKSDTSPVSVARVRLTAALAYYDLNNL